MEPVTACIGVELKVEIVPGLWDFQAWVAPLQAGMAGITIQEHGEMVNHMFRFVARQDLGNYRIHKKAFCWEVDNAVKEPTML